MNTSTIYRFPGIVDFVPKGGVKPSFAAKIPGLFLVGRVADALSQIPTTPPEHRAGMFAVAREAVDALKAAVATAEAAYADVLAHCPPPEPPAAAPVEPPAPEPAPKPAPKGKPPA